MNHVLSGSFIWWESSPESTMTQVSFPPNSSEQREFHPFALQQHPPVEKEMATHSSTLAWRILWAGEPGGLPSIGSHRVGHDWSNLACMHALEKEMATHSSILAWRISGTEEPDGLPSMGSHRVGHDWSNLACMHALVKEMATHSSVLAWRIPGTEEPGGLPSMGSNSVRHDWSDSAAQWQHAQLLQLQYSDG